MSSVKGPRIVNDGNYHIIYDPELVESPSSDLFDVDHLKGQGVLEGTAGGRGASQIIRFPNRTWVLRHFRRGGFVGKILNDQYFGGNRDASRSWKEFHLLQHLVDEGFPVPRPVAASFIPSFGHYQADLITEYIPDSRTLAEILNSEDLDLETWHKVGACIARFHARGVFHADLNAHNILLSDEGDVFLIDFDKGELREQDRWCQENLNRLHRSLFKLKTERNEFHFRSECWQILLQGYQAETEEK